MTSYISLLRGINVSGQKRIKMDALQQSYEALLLQNVTTYIQSGNVVFEATNTSPKLLAPQIARQIALDFGFEVLVIVLTAAQLKAIIVHNPTAKDPQKDPSFLHITFLAEKPTPYDPTPIIAKQQSGEGLFLTDNALYLYCPNGYGRSKLTNSFLETQLKVGATTRNWKTSNELLKFCRY